VIACGEEDLLTSWIQPLSANPLMSGPAVIVGVAAADEVEVEVAVVVVDVVDGTAGATDGLLKSVMASGPPQIELGSPEHFMLH
jgi:hypothetical protein